MYRILALDGGGYRGHLTAMMLGRLQECLDVEAKRQNLPPKPLHQCFDLIVGTSTGSLIAGALARGMSTSQIHAIYDQDAERIFAPRNLLSVLFKALTAPLFDGGELDNVLRQYLAVTTFGEISDQPGPDILVTAYDTYNNRPIIFGSYQEYCRGVQLFDACMASSAYPGGFPTHFIERTQATESFFAHMEKEHSYFSLDFSHSVSHGVDLSGIPLADGGLMASNPAALAIAEAIQNIPACRDIDPRRDLLVVSFGTGQMPPGVRQKAGRRMSDFSWRKLLGGPLQEMIYTGYSRCVDTLARGFLGDKLNAEAAQMEKNQSYFRFQPVLLTEGEFSASAYVSSNSVVKITLAERKAFSVATFQATPAVKALFERVNTAFFDDMTAKEGAFQENNPSKQLAKAATLLLSQ